MKETLDGCGLGSTWPICSKTAGNSDQGICDLSGNVREWVTDWWNDNYDGAPDDGSAWLSGNDRYRVVRGGWWSGDDLGGLRSASRGEFNPEASTTGIGFRCVR